MVISRFFVPFSRVLLHAYLGLRCRFVQMFNSALEKKTTDIGKCHFKTYHKFILIFLVYKWV